MEPELKVTSRGGSRNFERGVHKNFQVLNNLVSALTLFESLSLFPLKVSPPFWSTTLHQIIWRYSQNEAIFVILVKTKCLKCYTMYNIQIIIHHAGHMSIFFFLLNTSNDTFSLTLTVVAMQTCSPEWRTSVATPAISNVSIDTGVIGMQG